MFSAIFRLHPGTGFGPGRLRREWFIQTFGALALTLTAKVPVNGIYSVLLNMTITSIIM